jgi:hypothetical protein
MKTVYALLLLSLLLAYFRALLAVGNKYGTACPLVGWLIGLGYFILAPLSLITIHGGYELPGIYEVGNAWGAVDLSTTRFIVPYLVVWLSMMGSLFVVCLILPPSHSSTWWKQVDVRRLERAIATPIVIAVVDWTVLIWLLGGVEEFLVSHWQSRTEEMVVHYGDLFVLLSHLGAANQVVFTGAAILHTSIGICQREMRWGFTCLLWVFFLLEVVVTGNRIYLAIYLLSVIACLHFEKRWKVFALILSFAPILVFVFSMWSAVRGNLSTLGTSVGDYVERDDRSDLTSSLINVTEGMNVLLLMHIVDDYGSRFDYLNGITYSRAVISLVPRRLFPQKPQNFTALMAEQYLPNVETSLNATALGEMYANFGPLTLLFFPALTGAIVVLNNWSSRTVGDRPLLRAILFVLLVWVARSTFEDNFVLFLLCLLLIRLFRIEDGLTRKAIADP